MKRLFLVLPFLISATAFGGAFTAGDLVVVTLGDGSTTLSGASAAATLYEYSTGGSLQQMLSLPSTFSLAGSATSEGFLTLSTDGNYLTMGGYNAPAGTAGIVATASATTARLVARIDMSGNMDTTTALSDAYSAGNIRSAVSTDGSSIWTSGTAVNPFGAARSTTFGTTTSVQLDTSPTNVRVVNIYNGQLYLSSASGTFLGVSTVGSGLPTTSGQTVTVLPGMPTTGTHSPYDFWFKDANTLYVADDGSAANSGGIQKWTLSGTTWSLSYTLLNNGTTTTGTRGLAGTLDGSGNAVLFATTSVSGANSLITLTDTGAGSTATVLATAPANDVFRGVEFLPAAVPEPSGFALAGLGLLALAAYRRARR